MRGEYQLKPQDYAHLQELPPRARRIPPATIEGLIRKGTTSACAENTTARGITKISCVNYLRVRGEYDSISDAELLERELPPRARRIQIIKIIENSHRGTTSACAENTLNELGLL